MLTLDHHPHVPENPLGALLWAITKILKEYCVLYSKEIISEKRIRVLPLKHCTYVLQQFWFLIFF